MLRRLRPLIALCANLALVNAMWIGSARACMMPDASPLQPGDMVGMNASAAVDRGMDMSGAPTSTRKPQSSTPADRHTPCRVPWAPGGCQATTPFATRDQFPAATRSRG